MSSRLVTVYWCARCQDYLVLKQRSQRRLVCGHSRVKGAIHQVRTQLNSDKE